MRLVHVGIGFFLMACSTSPSDSHLSGDQVQFENDSLKKILLERQRIKQFEQDSIELIEQQKVIGEIKFGMRKEQVDLLIEKFQKENRRPDKTLGIPFYDNYIGEYEYLSINAFYYNKGLYEIKVQGSSFTWEKYDRNIPEQLSYITDIINQKYGEPDTHSPLRDMSSMEVGYSYLVNQWQVGGKTIDVRVESIGRRYSVNVVIFLNEVRNIIKKSKEEEVKKSTEKAKDIF